MGLREGEASLRQIRLRLRRQRQRRIRPEARRDYDALLQTRREAPDEASDGGGAHGPIDKSASDPGLSSLFTRPASIAPRPRLQLRLICCRGSDLLKLWDNRAGFKGYHSRIFYRRIL